MEKRTGQRKKIKIVLVLVSLIFLAFLAFTLTNIYLFQTGIATSVQTYGIPALFLISLLLDLIPQFISPVVVLGLGILAKINIYAAIISVILGSTIGSTLGFSLGKKYMFDAVNALAKRKNVNKMTELINKYGKIIIPLAAISPLPYIPVVLGAINLSKKNFLVYGLIPRILSLIAWGYIFYLF